MEEMKEALLNVTLIDMFWAFVRNLPWIAIGFLINTQARKILARRRIKKYHPDLFAVQIKSEIEVINEKIDNARRKQDWDKVWKLESMRRKLYHQIGKDDPADDV